MDSEGPRAAIERIIDEHGLAERLAERFGPYERLASDAMRVSPRSMLIGHGVRAVERDGIGDGELAAVLENLAVGDALLLSDHAQSYLRFVLGGTEPEHRALLAAVYALPGTRVRANADHPGFETSVRRAMDDLRDQLCYTPPSGRIPQDRCPTDDDRFLAYVDSGAQDA